MGDFDLDEVCALLDSGIFRQYLGQEDCIAQGKHLTDCDDDGYCNHCGFQDWD